MLPPAAIQRNKVVRKEEKQVASQADLEKNPLDPAKVLTVFGLSDGHFHRTSSHSDALKIKM